MIELAKVTTVKNKSETDFEFEESKKKIVHLKDQTEIQEPS